MTGSVIIKLRCCNGNEVVVGKKRYEVYDDEWDMLKALQDWFGCLPWRKYGEWDFVAEVVCEDGNYECFTAELITNKS